MKTKPIKTSPVMDRYLHMLWSDYLRYKKLGRRSVRDTNIPATTWFALRDRGLLASDGHITYLTPEGERYCYEKLENRPPSP